MSNFISRKKIRVNFVIAGTQKGGTSVLDQYLRSCPEICMANSKELHFFDNEKRFVNKKVDYSFYHSCFSPRESDRLFGESTPVYMYWYPAPRRIWEYNSAMKWILILRNPVERAFSHWNMERDRGREPLSFLDAIMKERARCRDALPHQHRAYSYVDRGFYAEQIRRIWHYFPVEQTLILRNEALRNEFRTSLDKVCDFLGVQRLINIEPKVVHSRPYVAQLTESERNYLKDVYRFEIRELERLLGWDCSQWLNY
jgi:Sulfotransferase domain